MKLLILLVAGVLAQYNSTEVRGRELNINTFEKRVGSTNWVLITSFNDTGNFTGRVYAVPLANLNASIPLVTSNLTRPIAICFNVKDKYMYVIDQTSSTRSFVLQYAVQFDDISLFEVIGPSVNITSVGLPSDCEVDAQGNLWFVDYVNSVVSVVNYIDLLAQNIEAEIEIYTSASNVSEPYLMDIYDNQFFYFLNTYDPEGPNQFVAGSMYSNLTDEVNYTSYNYDLSNITGFVLGNNYAFFANASGTIYSANLTNLTDLELKVSNMTGVFSMCFSSDRIFLSNFYDHNLYAVYENNLLETPREFIAFYRPYKIYCVNIAEVLGLLVLSLLVAISF